MTSQYEKSSKLSSQRASNGKIDFIFLLLAWNFYGSRQRKHQQGTARLTICFKITICLGPSEIMNEFSNCDNVFYNHPFLIAF